MRDIELNELNLKIDCDEERFYKLYLKGLKSEIKENKMFKKPGKEYEICYLNILGGKILVICYYKFFKEGSGKMLNLKGIWLPIEVLI